MIRFTGRASEITTVPNKPIPTGVKVWNIAQRGFVLRWNWHKPGSKFGPVRVKTPRELGGTASGREGNKTQAVVLHLLKQLPSARYHVYLDNLFTSYALMELLRSQGFGATSTCQTNAGVISELIDIKKNDKGKDEMPWGTLISMLTALGLVNQCGWKDNAFALTMSTVHDRKSRVTRVRKRPKKTSSKAKTARVPFGDKATKELEIPELYDCYNHNMLAVDVADQLASSNSGHRRIRRGAWQALDQWLLITVLVNCYLVAFYAMVEGEREIKFRSQRDFRIQLVEGLLAMSQRGPGPQKRRFSHSNYDDSEVPITNHHHAKRLTRSDCMACKGGTYWERPLRRSPLAQISANQKGHSKRRNTFYGCTECNVALCKEGPCFNRYHGISSN
jgi:hypothetical protein